MPSAPSARLGLTSPLTTEAAAGPANIATLIAQLEAAVGMAWLGEVTSAGGAGSALTFSAINQNFRHLQIRGVVKSLDAGVSGHDPISCRINGDSGGNYSYRAREQLSAAGDGADGLGITTLHGTSLTAWRLGQAVNSTGTSSGSQLTAFMIDIFDYAGAVRKQFLARWASSLSGTLTGPEVGEAGGSWASTAAITSVSLFASAGAGLATTSRAALYGLR